MKPTLHRSIIFWAGILMLTFTCWSWWDSYSYVSRLEWKQLKTLSAACGLVVARDAAGGTRWHTERSAASSYSYEWKLEHLPSPHIARAHIEPDPEESEAAPELPKPPPSLHAEVQAAADEFGPGSWAIFIPYWLILLLILITWLALLFLRARRLRRTHALADPS